MYKKLLDKLKEEHELSYEEYLILIKNYKEVMEYASMLAKEVREEYFSDTVYIRGLIEFSNYCKNNCYYCGIRAGNKLIERYRLSEEEILSCVDIGHTLGFRTFVLQSGEDNYYTDDILVRIIKKIKEKYFDSAITLSIGERNFSSYKVLREAGADRYLLRHETCDKSHYEMLHPKGMSFDNRMECVKNLKALGYQVGIGFMVGSPYQTEEMLARELLFLKEMSPQMVGIGPFLPHQNTPFKDKDKGSFELTLFLLSLIRLTLPNVLLPATTALGTINPLGREKGLLAGANVLMPNLSPEGVRKKYLLYDNKICTGDEAAKCIGCLKKKVASIGYKIVIDRGDFKANKEGE